MELSPLRGTVVALIHEESPFEQRVGELERLHLVRRGRHGLLAVRGLEITFTGVTEFLAGNSNNFVVTLNDDNTHSVDYGIVDATDGIAGRTPGGDLSEPDLGRRLDRGLHRVRGSLRGRQRIL